MKTLLRIFLLLLCALILLCVMLVIFGISDTPEIELDWSLTRDDIIRAKKILREGSKTKPDEISTIELSHADLNLAANYLLNRYSKSAVQISLKENKLKFVVTTTLPENRLGKYLNVTFRLGNEEGSQLPTITKFKAGKLLIPAKIAGFIINTLIEHSALNNYFMLATRPIQGIKIDPEKITISYSSNLETLITARNVLTHTDNTPALSIYQQKIADIIAHHDPNWRLSLADLLKPLFEIAYQRSNLDNAIEENRLVIISVNDYVNKKQNKQFLPASPPMQGKQYTAFLYKRSDLAQHFIGSAALTASVNDQVAKVVGEEKELSDAQGGSGFSFVDLAADKAGTRFGEIATSSPESARKLQLAMTQIKDYTDFMPDPRDLPEKMNEADFKSRYGSINSAAYQE
ncbi:MAG: hypothetical protein LUP96_05480, partial [Methylococcaceae bacterium]|nr:hypothetical protein [Methylococcaceae bacterium]